MSNLTTQNKDKLRKSITEIADSLTRIAAERDLQKEIIKKVSEELTIDKKIIRRMAKVYFNANFVQEVELDDEFEETYRDTVA
tara:strand:+ start:7794 stop:8042 length:249 start_codon:yes stop_codon:yes gene_type:complete